jgi:hypothetical protein
MARNISKMIVASCAALLAFFSAGILVTELLQDMIYFSLFIGIPAGVIAGLISFIVVMRISK